MKTYDRYSKEHCDELQKTVNGLCSVNQYHQQEVNNLQWMLKKLNREIEIYQHLMMLSTIGKEIDGKFHVWDDFNWIKLDELSLDELKQQVKALKSA